MGISKERALKIVLNSSLKFKENLENKNLMFIFLNENKIESTEVTFTKDSFLHLTGLVIDKNRLSAKNFYKKCIRKRLAIREFNFKKDGTTYLKLSVLNKMMDIHKDARYIGDYNSSRPFLITNTLAGDKFSVMGFQKYNTGIKPNTLLKENIIELTNNAKNIIAILRKNIEDEKYLEVTYCNPNINLDILLEKLQISYMNENNVVLQEVAATEL